MKILFGGYMINYIRNNKKRIVLRGLAPAVFYLCDRFRHVGRGFTPAV